jgi:hypothetical protein
MLAFNLFLKTAILKIKMPGYNPGENLETEANSSTIDQNTNNEEGCGVCKKVFAIGSAVIMKT